MISGRHWSSVETGESACLAVSSYVMPLLKRVSPPTKHNVTLLGGSHNRDRAVIQDFNLEANSHQLQSNAPGSFSNPHARDKSLWQTTVGIVHVVKNLKWPYRCVHVFIDSNLLEESLKLICGRNKTLLVMLLLNTVSFLISDQLILLELWYRATHTHIKTFLHVSISEIFYSNNDFF